MKRTSFLFCLALTLLVVVFALPTFASAEPGVVASGTCGAQGDNLTWTLYDNGELVIGGEGDMADYRYANAPWISYRDTIQTVTVQSGITRIDSSPFWWCSNLTSISVDSSNNNYSSLDGVLFNKAQTELLLCPAGKTGTYEVPITATCIGEDGFRNCTSLTHITLPTGLRTIGERAFYSCSSLTGINLPAGLTKIGNSTFALCGSLTDVELPAGVTSIGNDAFYYCSKLTSIIIPAGVTHIGFGTFSYCKSLAVISVSEDNHYYSSYEGVLFNKARTELLYCPGGKTGTYTVPNSVTSIVGEAFCGCSSLTSVTIPNSVTSIEDGTFADCSSLTSIIIPEDVTSIGISAFYNCSDLTDVYFGGTEAQRNEREGNGWITDGNSALFNATWHYSSTPIVYDCVLPADLTTIEQEALAGCAFRCVSIPDGVTRIGAKAFAESKNLAYVYIPESVTEIASNAFYHVTGLTVIGVAGSEAEAFAELLGYAFIEG